MTIKGQVVRFPGYPVWSSRALSIVGSKKPDKDEPFKCIRCGLCCLINSGTINASGEDISLWIWDERNDILEHPLVSIFLDRDGFPIGADILPADEKYGSAKDVREAISSKQKALEKWNAEFYWNGTMHLCPFLKMNKDSFACMIYDARPYMCRGFECKPTKLPEVEKALPKEAADG